MKTLVNILFCSMLLLTASIAGAVDKTAPCSVYIIIDQSWSTEHSNDDLCSLAFQTITGLSSGDYLEVISIHSAKPQIRLAQFMKSGSPQEIKQINTTLKSIKSGFLNDARLSKAVEFCLNRIKRSRQNQNFPAFIVAFSDGKRSDSDARAMEKLYPELKVNNVPLYMTGTKQANRKFLIAANKGLMDFSLLSDANPAQWLKDKLYVPADITKDAVSSSQSSGNGFEINARSETSIKFPKQQAVKPAQPKPSAIKPVKPKEKVRPKPKQSATVSLVKKPVKTIAKPVDKTPVKKKPLSAKHWLLLGLLAAAVMLLAFFLFSYRQARHQRDKTRKTLKRTQKPSGSLIARYKEQVFHLGKVDQLRQIHIGSAAKNTIRIFDNSVTPQHVRIYRKLGSLMFKNLSSKIIYSNGVPTNSGKTSRLTLPCSLKLSDSVTVKLELQKSLALNSPEKEASNGTQK